MALSNAGCDTILIMALLKEIKPCKFDDISIVPSLYCEAFQDNPGTLELAHLPKICSRTKSL